MDDSKEVKKCQQCKIDPGTDAHTCPYKEDIKGDYETKCNCCDDCKRQCRMSI
jgi:hypothetical protein